MFCLSVCVCVCIYVMPSASEAHAWSNLDHDLRLVVGFLSWLNMCTVL